MTPKASRDELVAIKVRIEQQWAYERCLEHLSYFEMRRLVSAPVEAGGLGYDISEHRLKGLVNGYRDAMRETLEADIEMHRERELADLDLQHRALVSMLGAVDESETRRLRATIGAAQELTLAEVAVQYPEAVVPKSTKDSIAILAQLRQVGESRRKLLGLDAPQQIKADVVVRDAVTEELNAMLERAGRQPIKTES